MMHNSNVWKITNLNWEIRLCLKMHYQISISAEFIICVYFLKDFFNHVIDKHSNSRWKHTATYKSTIKPHMNADRDRPASAIEIEQKKVVTTKRINRWCIFSIWFSFSFSLVSRFKRYPSWQYRNKCQNLIWIYCTKQFQKKYVDKPNLRHSVFFCRLLKNWVWCLNVQLEQKNNITKNDFYFQLSPETEYICDCKML